MVSTMFTPVKDTFPVLVTVIVYWMVSPGPLISSPSSTTIADLVTSNDGVALINVTTSASISSDTAVLSPSSAVAVTEAVLDTPPASIAVWVTAKVAVKVTSSPTCRVATLVSGSDVKVVFAPSVELVNIGPVVNEIKSPFRSDNSSSITTPLSSELPVFFIFIVYVITSPSSNVPESGDAVLVISMAAL